MAKDLVHREKEALKIGGGRFRRILGAHDAKPSHEELKDWLHSGQVDVLRMGAK
jgi:hypothetical protein